MELPTVESELAKAPDLPLKNLEVLKEWIDSEPTLPPISEIKLIQFHYSCYYDVEKTKDCIKKFYEFFRTSPEYFQNRDITSERLQTAMKLLNHSIFARRTPDGSQIIFQKLSTTNTREFDFCDGIKLLSMMMSGSLHYYGLAPSTIAILDYKNCSLGHIFKSTIPMWKKVIYFLETSLPIRLKGIHVINTNYYTKKLFVLLKPFVGKEIQKVLHFYQTDELDQLYNVIPLECLPEDYGGLLPSVEELQGDFEEQMLKLREIFLQEEEEILNLSLSKKQLKGGSQELSIL